MAAMVRMYELKQDARYLDHLFDLIQVALEFRDDRPLDSDPNVSRPLDEIRNKVGLPAWGGGLLDNYGLHSVLELTSSYYAYPIAAFARILAEDPAIRARYECKVITIPGPQTAPINRRCADAVLYANRVIETVEVFLPQIHQQRAGDFIEAMLMHPAEYSHRPTPADCDAALNDANSREPQRKDRWQKEHGYCLDDQKLAGKPLPHNQNLLFSKVLIELSRVLDTDFYKQSPARASRAESIREFSFRIMPRQQRYFVDNLNPKSLSDNDDYPACKNELCWYYNGAPGTLNFDPEDTDHGSMDMTYVGLFFRDIDRLRGAAERSNEQFARLDLQGLARTFVFTIAPDTNVTGKNFKSDVAGRQNKNDAPEQSNSRCEGWLELTRADLRVWNLCQEMSLRIVDGQQPYLNIANHSALLNSKQFLPGP